MGGVASIGVAPGAVSARPALFDEASGALGRRERRPVWRKSRGTCGRPRSRHTPALAEFVATFLEGCSAEARPHFAAVCLGTLRVALDLGRLKKPRAATTFQPSRRG